MITNSENLTNYTDNDEDISNKTLEDDDGEIDNDFFDELNLDYDSEDLDIL